MLDLRERFLNEAFAPNGTPVKNIDVVVTAVRLPNGAIETITNYQGIETKLQYLRDAYDDMFRLNVNPEIEIVGYMIY